MTADDEVRDAHHRALRWSHAIAQQVDRLHADRAAGLVGQDKVRAGGFYGHEDAWPFHMMEADKHFAMVPARQLLRALRAFDGDDRLPATLPAKDVGLVRERNSQYLWIGVLRGLLISFPFVGSFDEFAVLEPGAGSDEGHEVGCVHGTPAGLC